ncbi:hypothetical protein SLEP1_g16030 [Rubroshorea leprosula]|uniref:Uncharacterized protein n=1 Tax=Rubroshorea leprosula TaxID=152421 RepID=A0AAV5IV65_9ROSI|nr:hypothetical protein SLEP1_g16030 [Rubroshorea leprosula]
MASPELTHRGHRRKTGTLKRRLKFVLYAKQNKTLKRMRAKVAGMRREMNRVRMETADNVAAMEEMRMELDYQFDVMLLVSVVDSLSSIILQL